MIVLKCDSVILITRKKYSKAEKLKSKLESYMLLYNIWIIPVFHRGACCRFFATAGAARRKKMLVSCGQRRPSMCKPSLLSNARRCPAQDSARTATSTVFGQRSFLQRPSQTIDKISKTQKNGLEVTVYCDDRRRPSQI